MDTVQIPPRYSGPGARNAPTSTPVTRFGADLRTLRNATGLSQSKLAEQAGFDHSYISRLEAGVRMPARETVDFLAVALGATKDERSYLLASAGFFPDDLTGLLNHEPEVQRLLRVLSNDDIPEGRRSAIRRELASLCDLVS